MFLKRFALAGAFGLIAFAANAETLVVAAPFDEFPELAAQMLDGAKAALGQTWDLKQVEAGCTETKAAGVAERILAEKPAAVIGLPCIESLVPALSALGPLGVPIISIGSRAGAPTKLALKNQWPFFRTGPRDLEDGEAIAKLIVAAWRNYPFAILDDGTVFAADIAAAIRGAAEVAGIKPVLSEGFQSQLESQKKLIDRLVAAGATHVFIASDRANIAQIATEAAGKNLTIAGPETLRASDLDYPLPAGVLMASRNSELSINAMAKINAIRQPLFSIAEGYAADSFIATEIAMKLEQSPALRAFETAAGAITIASDGFVQPVQYALFRFDGTTFERVGP